MLKPMLKEMYNKVVGVTDRGASLTSAVLSKDSPRLQTLMEYHSKIEVRENQQRIGCPFLVNPRCTSLFGERFRSYFEYPTQTFTRIINQGSTDGLFDMPLICNEIFIDVDKDVYVSKVRTVLLRLGIRFTEYSARRGKHFHIPIERLDGLDIPWSVKMWLMTYFEPEEVDMSMIHHAGQIRLIGAVHEKDGSIKTMIRSYPGNTLKVPKLTRPKVSLMSINSTLSADDKRRWNAIYTSLRLEGVGEGNRYPTLFKIIMASRAAGINPEVVKRQCLEWNTLCKPSHSEDYILRNIERIWRTKCR